jgi:hypothetical protein
MRSGRLELGRSLVLVCEQTLQRDWHVQALPAFPGLFHIDTQFISRPSGAI